MDLASICPLHQDRCLGGWVGPAGIIWAAWGLLVPYIFLQKFPSIQNMLICFRTDSQVSVWFTEHQGPFW